MTFIQLEYCLALELHQNFSLAAEACHVTQPTLSLQIQKLEDSLDIKIFDRRRKPVSVTEVGRVLLDQARVILQEKRKLMDLIEKNKGTLSGKIKVGIIPTLAPYLLPLFLVDFLEKHPDIKVSVSELMTQDIIQQLKQNQLDLGIIATPLEEVKFEESPLFYEPLVLYISPQHPLFKKRTLKISDLKSENIWVLNEGHCLRSQILKICQSSKSVHPNLTYQTSNLETLKRVVELNQGITILPELAIADLNSEQMEMIRYFDKPEPVREISLIRTHSDIKEYLIQPFRDTLSNSIPAKMLKKGSGSVIPIDN